MNISQTLLDKLQTCNEFNEFRKCALLHKIFRSISINVKIYRDNILKQQLLHSHNGFDVQILALI